MMPPIEKIPDEVRNRLGIWRLLIKETYESLLVAEELWQMIKKDDAYQEYSRPYVIAEKNRHYNFCVTAQTAIFTQVVIFFGNIYGPGEGGVGFSKNANEQCKLFKKEMESFVLLELKMSDTEFQTLKNKMIDRRHQQVAHFDGSKAEYTVKPNGWVTTHKLPFAHFNQEESVEIKALIKAMYTHIEKYFTFA